MFPIIRIITVNANNVPLDECGITLPENSFKFSVVIFPWCRPHHYKQHFTNLCLYHFKSKQKCHTGEIMYYCRCKEWHVEYILPGIKRSPTWSILFIASGFVPWYARCHLSNAFTCSL